MSLQVWLHYSAAEQVAIDTPDLYTQLVQADKDSPDMVISELVERGEELSSNDIVDDLVS